MARISRAEVDGSIDPTFYADLIGTDPSVDVMDILNRGVINRAADGGRQALGANRRAITNVRRFTGHIESVLHGLARVVDWDGEVHCLTYDDMTEQWVEYSEPNGLVVGVYDGLRATEPPGPARSPRPARRVQRAGRASRDVERT